MRNYGIDGGGEDRLRPVAGGGRHIGGRRRGAA
jgi:hypothetical protein